VEHDRSSDTWRGMGLLAASLAAMLVLHPLFLATSIPLLDPDEGLHASIAQEMVERGDWLVPRLLGEPFLDKPILYFWAEAASLRVFGMSEVAVRLPGLMFGLLGALTTALLAGRMFSRATGILAGLFYSTMVLPTALAQAAAHDVALVPWVNLALLAFWELDRGGHAWPARRTTEFIAFSGSPQRNGLRSAMGTRTGVRQSLACVALAGLALGLAILTKGFTGVAMVGISFTAYSAITRRLTIAACLRGSVALGIAVTIASAWYLAVETRVPGFLHYYFVDRHLLGFATATQRHGSAPWWYYLPILLGGGLPWISYLPVAVQDGWARWRVRSSAARCIARTKDQGPCTFPPALRPPVPSALLWCWLIGCTVLLSISHSKLVTYVWPVFPALAILVAVVWTRLLDGELNRAARRSMACTFWLSSLLAPAALLVALWITEQKFHLQFSVPTWLAGAVLGAATLVPAGFWLLQRPRAVLASGMLVMALHGVFLITAVVPGVAGKFSARELARNFNRRGFLPPRLIMAEERLGSLMFYLTPELRSELQPGQLTQVKLDRFHPSSELGPGEVLMLPDRFAHRDDRCDGLSSMPYETVDRYRLYRRPSLESQFQTATRGGNLQR
jgi:4-amino-4-deoxy-L-arabinose transferase-like glycosyltransferase